MSYQGASDKDQAEICRIANVEMLNNDTAPLFTKICFSHATTYQLHHLP
jgi:hypothetical protein